MRATGGRVAALAVGLPFVVAAVGFGGFTVVGDFARVSERHVASYSWNGGAITVRTSGSVTVSVGSSSQVVVTYTEHYQLRKPKVTSSTSAGGVRLTATCPSGLYGDNCQINYVLTVPAAAALDIQSGDGSINLSGSSGEASLDTGDGSIDFDNVSGAVVAHTGDGHIDGTQVRSTNVQAMTGDGHVHIGWSVAPTTVVVTTGDGSINLVVPQGSGPFRTSTHTGDGSVHVSSLIDAKAVASITAETGNGGITIGYPGS